MPTRDDVIEALRGVEDPELGMDIVELGLRLRRRGRRARSVKVLYSLTSMGCPAGPLIQQNVEETVRAMPEVEDVETELDLGPAVDAGEDVRRREVHPRLRLGL